MPQPPGPRTPAGGKTRPELGNCPGTVQGQRRAERAHAPAKQGVPSLTHAGRENHAVHVTGLQPESDLPAAKHICSWTLGGSFRKGEKEQRLL